ncbi:hypothetical protein MNB_ARC-1_1140 [hydrothermal vent metagenome]|uniref:Prepilin-type N-terminal cleavage/methylation domain-containing protein n=1 Tax=hydrothermal vent metagenome TaxID=652676 RepID=A0A3B1E717_9ZZZZ
MKKKQGFSLMEIFVSIAIVGLLTWYASKSNIFEMRRQKINTAHELLVGFFNSAVFHLTLGYPSSRGGYCSKGDAYRDITAERIVLCTKLKSFTVGGYTEHNSTDGTQTYLTGIFSSLVDGEGGKVYFLEDNISSEQIYIFFDLSEASGSSLQKQSRNRASLERIFMQKISKSFATAVIGVYPKALDIKTKIGGRIDDGKFMIKISK